MFERDVLVSSEPLEHHLSGSVVGSVVVVCVSVWGAVLSVAVSMALRGVCC